MAPPLAPIKRPLPLASIKPPSREEAVLPDIWENRRLTNESEEAQMAPPSVNELDEKALLSIMEDDLR